MTFDDMSEGLVGVPRAVTITGTRATADVAVDVEQALQEYVLPFAKAGVHFYLGGAAGIDTMGLRWLAEHTSVGLSVVVPRFVVDQPASATGAVAEWNECGRLAEVVELGAAELDTAAYHARNRWMVDRSEFVIGFPFGDDPASGTWYTLNYAAEHGKPRLVVPL